ncbi:twin-arginine translocase subunit TatC [Ktedonosporobacter rubrisoli]|uniref:Sec-independent protein translocase protein TatC n=1 Tax=Ktedonosporobacter rubrisoli TaxID=2509675 RepID=A0A4P6JUK2_KTERU|nr:twin-arginine translocase subunit TatC [Ktedonosporobacter rubrisoli]QBD79164.1 twin-arginine translocase subunit TatC [Ktedonosporobacter rubrisoli]
MATGDIDQQDSLLALELERYKLLLEEEEDEENDPSSMSLVDHLEELRWRVFKTLIAIVIGAIIAFIFRDQIMHFLELPLPKEADALGRGKLVVTGVAEGFTVFLLLSVAVGIVLALPVLLYQVWAFVAPGLYEHEKKHAIPFIFIGIVLFLIGISLGYVVLHYPLEFLISFASSSFTELVTANSYFTFVAFFILAFGLIFELPLVLTFMAQVGLISADTLVKKRAAAHIGMWIAATFITPGADIYSPIIIGAAMSFLYELTIIFIRFTKRKEAQAA